MRFLMGYQIFFVLSLFIGLEVRANSFDRCMEMVKFEDEFDSIVKLGSEARFKLFCTTMTSFLRCINKAMKQETGLTLRELSNHWLMKGTENGKALTLLANIQDFVEEICSDKTALHREYMQNIKCFEGDYNRQKVAECKTKAIQSYGVFRRLQPRESDDEHMDVCVVTAYQLGCLGSALKDKCGDKAFTTYKHVLERIGFFRSGICSPEIMKSMKTTFIESLKMSEPQKDIYRAILELRKRRK